MELQEILNMKIRIQADLDKQAKVRAALESTLASLVKAEAILRGESHTESKMGAEQKPNVTKKSHHKNKSKRKKEADSPTLRVRAVMNKMQEEFTRQQLYDAVIQDGHGEIDKNYYSSVFQRLIAGKKIKLVSGEKGQPGSMYKRTELVQAAETSPAGEVI
jgi:hypothetical protein